MPRLFEPRNKIDPRRGCAAAAAEAAREAAAASALEAAREAAAASALEAAFDARLLSTYIRPCACILAAAEFRFALLRASFPILKATAFLLARCRASYLAALA